MAFDTVDSSGLSFRGRHLAEAENEFWASSTADMGGCYDLLALAADCSLLGNDYYDNLFCGYRVPFTRR